jgi:hemolysin activation/secretion protein
MMNYATRTICSGFAFLSLAPFACVVADVPAKQVPVKTEAQLERDKEDQATQKIRAERDLQVEQLNLPEDDTTRFEVKQLRINGNTLISTEQLLKNLPLVYDDSDVLLKEAKTNLKSKLDQNKAQRKAKYKRDRAKAKEQDREKLYGEYKKNIEKLEADYATELPKLEEQARQNLYDLRGIKDVVEHPGRTCHISTRTMSGLTKYFLSVYRDRGYAGIYVYVPAKAVQDGTKPVLKDAVLLIEIIEAKVSDTSTNYRRYDPTSLEPVPYINLKEGQKPIINESVFLDWSPVKAGQVINQKQLDDFINLLNLNPDRYVSAIISRGGTSDTVNLGYDIYERQPWHFYIQADNAGSDERQWSPRLGIINTNLTGRDDRITTIYQGPLYSHPVDPFLKNYSVYASYDFPILTPRLRLNLYAGHSNFDVFTDDAGGINFLGGGDYHGGILRFNVFQTGGWFVDVTGSLSHEESRISPSLGTESEVEMDLWGAGVDIHRSDDISNTSFSFNRAESFSGSSAEKFNDMRQDTDPDFTIYTASAAHSRYLDLEKIQRISGSFRLLSANQRLVQAKMTVFGGLYSVRGYEENEIVADEGIIASFQYEYDLVKHLESKQKAGENEANTGQTAKPWLRKLALLTFTDYGRAKTKHPIADEIRVQELSSAGLGIAATIGDNFDAGVYYGYPLRSTTDTDVGDGRWNFNLIYRF